jgi:glucose/arabinose dehydrogenase
MPKLFWGSAFLVCLAILASPGAQAAAPSVSISKRISGDGRTFSLTLTPASSAAGCAYSLFGSANQADFDNGALGGTRISRFAAGQGATKRTASNLNFVRRKNASRVLAYLRAQLICGGETSISEVFSVRMKLSSSGFSSVGGWLKQVGTRMERSSIALRRAFPRLSFSSPVALVSSEDGTKRLFVVEQGGRIYSFRNSASVRTKTLFFDIHDRISTGGELGLLGLAFHPNFQSNGKFYVNYTDPRPSNSSELRTVIASFTVDAANPSVADSNSETQLLTINQPFTNHKGGGLAFGTDGYLYIGLGDGGDAGDPLGNGQDRTELLGKMLRIDVDHQENSLPYAIPDGNPFKGNVSGYREEIFAYGFRNPFRFSYDRRANRLWVGDVGQGEIEEVDVVTAGGNYGWNIMEGSQCYPPNSSCSTAGLELPVTEYNHSVGQSIIGGYVYQGKIVPNLKGLYVFGDFVSGKIFSLLYDGANALQRTLLSSGLSISAFGQDDAGEVFVVSYGDGKLYRIEQR